MAYSVTQWFLDQLALSTSEPKKVLLVDDIDYSDIVLRWPQIKRKTQKLKSVDIAISLDNTNKALNGWQIDVFTVPKKCAIKFGFTHPTTGDELITLYTGYITDVKYKDTGCQLKAKDRLADFYGKIIGDTVTPVTFSSQNPADIAWDICTTYGDLDDTQSAANTDIDWDKFVTWKAIFTTDAITCAANYEGEKISKVLENLAKMTDSAIWIGGGGKVIFQRFLEADSEDFTITRAGLIDLEIDVDLLRMVNSQTVFYDYNTTTNTWDSTANHDNADSITTFGERADIVKDKTVWFTTLLSAENLAQRRVELLAKPPKMFTIDAPLTNITKEVGETLRIVDDFYDATDEQGFRIAEHAINLDRDRIKYIADTAVTGNPFILDFSKLDWDDRLY